MTRLGVIEQQDGLTRRSRRLEPRRHLSRLKRRHARVGIARSQEYSRIFRAGFYFLVRRVSVEEFELCRVRGIPIFEQRRRIIILEPVIADHIEIGELAQHRLKKLRPLSERRAYEQAAIAAALYGEPRRVGVVVLYRAIRRRR